MRSDVQRSTTRRATRTQVLDALRAGGPASRADLARTTGLSRSTISGLVGELIAEGLIAERAETTTAGRRGGRPGTVVSLEPAAGYAVAIDFGHTHLRVAVADLSSTILAEHELLIDVDGSATVALDAAAELTTRALGDAEADLGRVIGIAMGLPGPVDLATGAVGSSVIMPDWAGLLPAAELRRRLESTVDVVVDNDANLAAVGEARFGAAEGCEDVVYVKASSGIGAGILIGGRLHRGTAGSAGELGHVLHDPSGEVCRCGNRGCLETVAAAAPLLALLRRHHGTELTARTLVALSAEDVGVRRVLVDSGRAIGRALADLSNLLGPERLVIGGDLGGVGSPLLDGISESLERYALPTVLASLSVAGSKLGERAELLGGLSLVIGDTELLSSSLVGTR